MPCPSKDPGFGFSLTESVISFGMVIEGMLVAVAPAFESATMLATTAPAPIEESKNDRREASTVGLTVLSAVCAVWALFMVDCGFLGRVNRLVDRAFY